jgi:flagellin
VSDLLIRMRELAVQANSGFVSPIDRKTINTEYRSLIDEINRIGESTEFNGIGLLDGSTKTIQLQVGIGTTAGVDTITVENDRSLVQTLAVKNSKVTTTKNANKAIKRVDRALDRLNSMRGRFGSVQNRLASTISNLSNQFEAASAAESRIRDVDVAKETAELTKNRILQSMSLSVIAQMNAQPEALLRLFN